MQQSVSIASGTWDPRTTDETVPIPPRFWWLKRIALGVLVLLVAVVGLRVCWGCAAARRFEAKIAELRATGEPLFVEDFDFPQVPAEENCVPLLREAAAKIKWRLLLRTAKELMQQRPGARRDSSNNLVLILEDNVSPLALLAEGLQRPAADWGLDLSDELGCRAFSETLELDLAALAALAAVRKHDLGRDDEAVLMLAEVLDVSAVLGTCPNVAGHLSSLVAVRHAAVAIEQIAGDLKVAGPGEAPPEPHACQREDVAHLIDILMQEESRDLSFRQGVLLDRALCTEIILEYLGRRERRPAGTASQMLAADRWQRWVSLWLRPAAEIDAVNALQNLTQAVRMAEAKCMPEARRLLPLYPAWTPGWDSLTHNISRRLVPYSGGSISYRFELTAQSRLAAVRLALRLFELDHGKLPSALDALVPEYIVSVPEDPLIGSGKPIGYEPSGDDPGLFAGVPDDAAKSRFGAGRSTRHGGELDRYAARLRLRPHSASEPTDRESRQLAEPGVRHENQPEDQ